MNVRKEIHYTFNENDVRQLVADAIKSMYGFTVDPKKDITIRVNETTQGMGYEEYQRASFNCVEVKVVQN